MVDLAGFIREICKMQYLDFMFFRIFLVLFVLNSSTGFSQDQPWTLKRCIEYAVENNIQIKQGNLSVQMAEKVLLESKAKALPRVNANMYHGYNFGRTVDPFTNNFVLDKIRSNSFSINGSVVLFSGLQTLNKIKQSKNDLAASKWDSKKNVYDINLAIASNYLQILFNDEMVLVANNQVELSKMQFSQTNKLVKAGTLARGSLLDIQAQLSSDELQLIEAQNRLQLSYLSLMQLMDIPYESSFRVLMPEINIDTYTDIIGTAESIYAIALEKLPQIKSSNEKQKSAEKGVSIAKGGLLPTLTLGGSYGSGYSDARKSIVGAVPIFDTLGFTVSGEDVVFPNYSYSYETTSFNEQFKDNINQNIGFNLSIPVFNGLQTKTNIARAEIAFKNAQYNVQLEKQKLKENIQRSYFDAAAALKKYRSTKNAVVAYKEAFDYMKKKFDVGLVTALNFTDSKNKLGMSESELLQAKYDYVYKLKLLDFYQGNPMDL